MTTNTAHTPKKNRIVTRTGRPLIPYESARDRVNPRLTYGVREIASMLGVSVAFIRLEVGRHQFAVIRAGNRLLITKASLDTYIAERAV